MSTPITTTQVALTPILPFDAEAALQVLAGHLVPGAESMTQNSLTRLILTRSGVVAVTVEARAEVVVATVHSTCAEAVREVASTVRWWLDLDADPTPINAVLGDDPILGPYVRARPGLRVIKSPDAFEATVLTVVGQQVSVAAMRTFAGRLVAAFGTPGPLGLLAFPHVSQLANVEPAVLQRAVGLTGARTRTVLAVARAFEAGLVIGRGSDPLVVRRALLAIPGVGPWTADYIAVRALGDPDAFAPGDLVLQRALGLTSARAVAALSEAWRPYRAYALVHLWQGSY